MPPLPGEERVVTVYGDIHYYFAQPTVRPVLHRFDKASYVYIYYNSTRHTSRLEIANNAGKPEQDAFNGYLDDCHVINSDRFPTLVTIIVDPVETGTSGGSASSPRSRSDPHQWRLASADPRDQGKNLYRIHTMDVYLWTQEDARLVTDTFRRVLDPTQLDIMEPEEAPRSEEAQSKYQDNMSPVVQNLENVAISDPAYHNGQTRNSQHQAQGGAPQVSPPPAQTYHSAATGSPVSAISRTDSARPQDPAPAYAPLAYNPAAPPAPEPIAHREKTPPPEDDTDGTGLGAAAMHDQAYAARAPQNQPYTGTPGPVSNPYGHYGSPPPQSSTYGSPVPPPQQGSSISTFAPPPTDASSQITRHPSTSHQYAPPPTDPNQPVETPGTQFYNTLGHTRQPLTHVQPQYADYLAARPQPPPGGYSDYNYNHHQQQQQQQQQQQSQASGRPYDVHNQVYRPTEAEIHKPKTASKKPKSKVDEGSERVEKRLGGFLKKIEKRIG